MKFTKRRYHLKDGKAYYEDIEFEAKDKEDALRKCEKKERLIIKYDRSLGTSKKEQGVATKKQPKPKKPTMGPAYTALFLRQQAFKVAVEERTSRKKLFTNFNKKMKSILCIYTSTCPNCPAMKKYIQEKVSGYNIQLMGEDDKFFKQTCDKFKANEAPTVIMFDEKMEEIGRSHNVAELKALLKEQE